MPNGRNDAGVSKSQSKPKVKWLIWQRCNKCGEVYGADNIDELMKAIAEHKCKGGYAG